MSKLGETRDEYERRRKQQEAEAEAARENEVAAAEPKIRALAEALRQEERFLASVKAEVTVGFCKSFTMYEWKENRSFCKSMKISRINQWVCAIRWARERRYRGHNSLNMVYKSGQYCSLSCLKRSGLRTSEEYRNSDYVLVEAEKTDDNILVYSELSDDIDIVMKKIGYDMKLGNWDGWPIELEKETIYVQRGVFGRRFAI